MIGRLAAMTCAVAVVAAAHVALADRPATWAAAAVVPILWRGLEHIGVIR